MGQENGILSIRPERPFVSAEALLAFCIGAVTDWDGIVANTERGIWDIVRKQVLANYGKAITPDQQTQCQGQKIALYLKERWQLPDTEEQIAQLIKETKTRIIEKKGVSSIPDAVKFFRKLHELGFPMAVATSSDTDTVKRQAEQFGVAHCFQEILGHELTVTGKDKKALYIQAALRLGIRDLSRCVGIDDASSGVEAIKSAGMPCIAVPNPFRIEGYEGADFVLPSLASINLNAIPAKAK